MAEDVVITVRVRDQELREFTRDADGRLRTLDGRFAAVGRTGRRMGDGVDDGSRRGRTALRGLLSAAQAAGAGLLTLSTAGATSMGSLKAVGVAAGVTAAPAIGALVPMLAGAAAGALTAKLAFSGMGDAISAAGGDQKAYADAVKKLGPQQKDFVEAVADAKKEFKDFGKEVQKIVLPSFTKALKEADPLIKTVKGGVRDMSHVFAGLGDQFGALFKSGDFNSALKKNFSMGADFIKQITDPLDTLTKSVFDFGAKSKPTLDSFGRGIADLLGKGVPGFFDGLKGGISGAAAMFDGLFSGVNKLLPALGEFAGKVANAIGPALGDIFKSAASNATVALKGLGDVIAFLKPVWGEVGAMAKLMALQFQIIADVAKTAGTVILESLWPSFRQADQAVGPLQRLSQWFEQNRGAVLEFTRAASAGIIDFVSTVVTHIPDVIKVFRIMVTGFLTGWDAVISGAAKAFGWVPGLGPKLKAANKEFDSFKNSFISGLHGAEDSARDFAAKVAPRLAQNKLKMNIDNWQAQIAEAKKKITTVPKSKQAALRATIDDLVAKVGRAKRELQSLHDKNVRVTTTYTYKGVFASTSSDRDANGVPDAIQKRASGGPVRGPGTDTSDDVPIMASNNEYVMQASSVRKYGMAFMDAVNRGTLRAFARGGSVSSSERQARASAAGQFSVSHFGRMIGYRRPEFESSLASPGSLNDLAGTLSKWAATIKAATHGVTESRLLKALDSAGRKLVSYERAHEKVTAALAAAKDKLASLKDAAAQLRDSVASGITGSANITQVAQSGTATVGGILDQLGMRRDQSKSFADALAALKKRGLNSQSLSEIAQAGLEGGGLETATALMSASASDLKKINEFQKQIAANAKAAGATTADAMYGAGIKAADALVKGLEKQKARLEKVMGDVAKSLERSIKKAFGIKAAGGIVGGAATGGIRGGLTWVGEQGPELLRIPGGSRVYSNPDSRRMATRPLHGGGDARVVIEFAKGGSPMEDMLIEMLRKRIRVLSGGNVQAALGRG